MSLYYISIGPDDSILTLDTGVKALYGPTAQLALTSEISAAIKSETSLTGVIGLPRFTGSDILSDAWATFEWLKANNHSPVWISNPPPIPEVEGIP